MSGKAVSRATAGTVEDAKAAADAAAAAFPAWSAIGPGERRKVLLAAADGLEKRTADFIRIGCDETGATAGWMGFNAHLAAGMLREAASMTTQIGGEVIPSDKPGNLSMAVRQPVGVVVGIAPWNAPIILGVRALALPLACGNTVVLKASECARHAQSDRRCAARGRRAEGRGQCRDECTGRCAARGRGAGCASRGAPRELHRFDEGRADHRRAGARYLKPVLLELGGKSPLIVLDDADLDEAAKAANFGAFMNQGQICMSTERLIVDNSVADSFAKIFAAKAAALPAGNPAEKNVVLGSLRRRKRRIASKR